MKLFKISRIGAIALALSLTSCFEEHNELVPELEGVPAGGLTGVQLVSVEDDIAELEISLFVVDHFGSFLTGLSAADFAVEELPGGPEYSVLEVTEREDDARGAFSSTLLFDQSGSINSTDPLDARIEAGTAFAGIVSGGDEAAVAAFASGGSYQDPFELLQGFTSDQGLLTSTIENLRGRANGGTPLYRSIYGLIPFTAANGKNENRAIVAFTDGEDTDGGVSLQALIQEACANQMRIYTVGLGQGINEDVLSQVAFETGGAVMLAEDALQLISLYSSLGDLLHGQARLYTIKVAVRQVAGPWLPGAPVSGALQLPLSASNVIRFPFRASIPGNHTGSIWYDNLPACPCTYEEAQQLADSNCGQGKWLICGEASESYHYGAAFEVRWAPPTDKTPGQQCTYDAAGRLITSGIAAGSPDKVSPKACGLTGPYYGLPCPSCASQHNALDVLPWETGNEETVPCWQYLRDWPANNANGCAPDNPVTDIQHMRKLVGDMTCEEVTLLIRVADNSVFIDGSELQRYLLGDTNVQLSDEELIRQLEEWRDASGPSDGLRAVINQAIANLRG